MILAWFKAFVVTCLIEVPFVAWMLRRDDDDLPRRIGLLFFANLASHPAVWFIFPYLGLQQDLALGLSEGWAVLSEALFIWLAFRGISPIRAFGVSSLANGVSFAIGLLIYQFAARLLSLPKRQ